MNTKITILLFLITTGSSVASGQTNSFPSTGDVTAGSSIIIGTDQTTEYIHGVAAGGAIGFKTDSATFDRGISLGIMGNGQTNYQSVFEIDGYENSLFTTGKVGIGTSNPQGKLDIRPQGGSARIVFFSTSDEYPRIQIGGNSTSVAGVFNRLQPSAHIYFGETSDSGHYLFRSSGNVGIGTTTPDYKLDVKGSIRAEEVIVETGWSDFVFEDSYKLRSLEDVESHISKHGRLPDVPSASIVESEGLSLGEAQKIMMQKIEELTLYMIELKHENESLKKRVQELESN